MSNFFLSSTYTPLLEEIEDIVLEIAGRDSPVGAIGDIWA
jgi:hypothetical protein